MQILAFVLSPFVITSQPYSLRKRPAMKDRKGPFKVTDECVSEENCHPVKRGCNFDLGGWNQNGREGSNSRLKDKEGMKFKTCSIG